MINNFFFNIGIYSLTIVFFIANINATNLVFWNPYTVSQDNQNNNNLIIADKDSIWTELNSEEAEKIRVKLPSASALVKKVAPAVLVVYTESFTDNTNTDYFSSPESESYPFDDFFKFFDSPHPNYMPKRKTKGQGSGFIIHPSGLALTNQHVVANAEKIIIKVGDNLKQYEAEIIGSDSKTDIALIKIKGDLKKWPTMPLGKSSDLEVGDFAVAIGNPLGLELSVSMGIVSARGRADIIPSGRNGIYNFIQIDAPINPGNSGGPLLNLAGEVVGINTAISAVGQGIGFAIPIDQVKQILPQLKEMGFTKRSWMGVQVQPVSQDLAEAIGLKVAHGALVREVIFNGPAQKSGIQPGDIITHFNEMPLKNHSDLRIKVALEGIGKKIKISIFREKRIINLNIILGEMPLDENIINNANNSLDKGIKIPSLGLVVTTLNDSNKKKLDLEKELSGAQVINVDHNPITIACRIEINDVITNINNNIIKNAEELKNTMDKIKVGDTVRIFLRRSASTIFIVTLKQ